MFTRGCFCDRRGRQLVRRQLSLVQKWQGTGALQWQTPFRKSSSSRPLRLPGWPQQFLRRTPIAGWNRPIRETAPKLRFSLTGRWWCNPAEPRSPSCRLLLTLFHKWRVVLFRHFNAAMAKQQRHPIDRNTFVQQLNRERVTKHVSMAAFWSSIGLANFCCLK